MCKLNIVLSLGLLLGLAGQADAAAKKILGIFYEGCEKTCEGLKDGIAKSGFDAEVTILDLAQDKKKIPGAIETARGMKPDAVVVYGTTATLGVIGAMADAGKPQFLNNYPVVFTAVADPVGSKVVKDLKASGRDNVTGTFNRVPEALNVQIIRRYDAGFNKLGLLYHRNEKNSVQKMEELKKLAPELGFELVALEIEPGSTEVPKIELIDARLKELKQKGVKWHYVGSSSFLNANGKLFTEKAVEKGIAIVSPYPALVREHSALLSIAAPREEVGELAAKQVLRILADGAKPGELPILVATHFTHAVNIKVAKQLNLLPPSSFKSSDTEFVLDYYLSSSGQ
ncbi:MAG: ABC transporter substrate-binding protein [Aestuariivirga sp.]